MARSGGSHREIFLEFRECKVKTVKLLVIVALPVFALKHIASTRQKAVKRRTSYVIRSH